MKKLKCDVQLPKLITSSVDILQNDTMVIDHCIAVTQLKKGLQVHNNTVVLDRYMYTAYGYVQNKKVIRLRKAAPYKL